MMKVSNSGILRNDNRPCGILTKITLVAVTAIVLCISGVESFVSPVTQVQTRTHHKSCNSQWSNSHHHKVQNLLKQESPSSSCITLYSSSTSSVDEDDASQTSKTLGALVLLSVPVAWGTYTPVVKYVYQMNPPVPGIVFSAGYYIIAAVTLLALTMVKNIRREASVKDDDDTTTNLTVRRTKKMDIITNTNEDESIITVNNFQKTLAGVELGSYLFIGNCLQVVGLKSIPADRAAFLVQLTTILVPLVQATIAGDLGAVSISTWVACALAFIGVAIMGLDGPDFDSLVGKLLSGTTTAAGDGTSGATSFLEGAGDAFTYSNGDGLIILAAVAYTMHVVRLGKYAKLTSPLELAASKATVEAFLSVALVSLFFFLPEVGTVAGVGGDGLGTFWNEMKSEITLYFQTIQSQFQANAATATTQILDGSSQTNDNGSITAALGACLWTGWVTCAYTIYAQSFGQRRVSPTDANLIYTSQPIFSSLFAWVLLGESLGFAGYLGGGFIGFALYLVTLTDGGYDDTEETSNN